MGSVASFVAELAQRGYEVDANAEIEILSMPLMQPKPDPVIGDNMPTFGLPALREEDLQALDLDSPQSWHDMLES